MLPGSAVPVIVSVLSLVIRSPFTPVSWLTLITPGAAGGVVSTAMLTGALAGPVLPFGSVWAALKLWGPSASGGVVKLQLPLPSTKAVPIGLPLS